MTELLRVVLLALVSVDTPVDDAIAKQQPESFAAVHAFHAAPLHSQDEISTLTGYDPMAVRQRARADAWLGPDKFRHFWMSYAATAAGFAAARAADQDHDAALAVGITLSALAGIGKEIADRRSYGLFSVRDVVADALGIGAAYFLLREVH
jgi:putative lipoprotein